MGDNHFFHDLRTTTYEPSPVKPIAQAASVLLTKGPGSPEVLMVRRSESLRFFGGFFVFPGGKVAAADAEVPLVPAERPTDRPTAEHVRYIAAAREVFEEIGVLVARSAGGEFPPASPELAQCRRDLAEERLSFAQVLTRFGLAVHQADFIPVGHLVTPPFTSPRF